MAVRISGTLATTDPSDVFATHDSVYGKGGLREVANAAARNAITTERRQEGMLVYTQDDDKYWKLGASPWNGTSGDWTEHNPPVTSATQAALDLKANLASPTFTGTVITPLVKITGGTPGQGKVLTSDADGDASWEAPTEGSGATNLSVTPAPTAVIVASDTGTDATIPAADGTNAGLMVPAQKTKLDGIETGATADQTAGEILTAVKTVDGIGSGLDSDTVDGNEATALLARANHTGTQLAATISDFSTAADARIAATALDLASVQTITGAKTFNAGAFLDKGNQVYNAKAYGAIADARTVGNANITASQAILTTGTSQFTAGDVGKQIYVWGAGASGANLRTTIASYQSATQVTLAAAAGTTVSNGKIDWGTDNRPLIQLAIDAAGAAGGGTVYIPAGTYLIASTASGTAALNVGTQENIAIIGAGQGATTLRGITKSNGEGITMISFGNASSTTTFYSNYMLKDLTVDMNLVVNTFMYGVVFGACQNVLMDSVSVINSGAAPVKNMLYFGVTSANSSQIARDFTCQNCWFENNNGSYEAVIFSQARNVTFKNNTIRDVAAQFGLLQYGSWNVLIEGNRFEEGADIRMGTEPSRVIGNDFVRANCELTGSIGSIIQGNTFDGGTAPNSVSGVRIRAFFPLDPSEIGWEMPAFPFTLPCRNTVIDGNTFRRCGTFAILAGTSAGDQGSGVFTIMDCDNLIVTNNFIEETYQIGVAIVSKRLIFANNVLFNSGQLGTSSVKYNMSFACEQATIVGNTSYDDQGAPTVTRDFFIDDQFSGSLLPTQDLTFANNDFRVNGKPRYYNGSSFTDTKPAGISIRGSNNKGSNPTNYYAQGDVSGGTTFNVANGHVIGATLTGNITVTMTAGNVPGDTLTLLLTQDGTGNRSATSWSANVKWAGGTAPTLSTAAAAITALEFRWDGTNWIEVSRPAVGGGDATGPASSTDNAVARFDSTTGKLLQNSTVTIGDSGGITTTIASGGSAAGLTITQNDAINNQRGVFVTNTGSGNSVLVDANGNTGTTTATSGAILVENTGNTGIGLNVYSDIDASTAAPLVRMTHDNVAADQPVLTVQHDGTATAFEAIHNGTVAAGDVAFDFQWNGDNSNAGATGLRVYSNFAHSSSSNGRPVMAVANDNASSAAQLVYLTQDGSNTAIVLDNNNSGRSLDVDQDVTNASWANGTMRFIATSNVTDAATYSKSGVILEVTSNVVESSGTITDTAKVLAVANTHVDATGSVVDITNYGTGQTVAGRDATGITWQFSRDGGLIINERALDVDSRFEGVTDANLFFLDASTNRIGIGTATPSEKLHVSGNVQLAEAGNVVVGTTTGTKIGTAVSQKLGFFNATPVVQPASASQVAVATTAATSTTPFGYTTQAQADAIVTLVNEMRTSLVNLGIIKGAA